ncbi:uncharacterized protein LOC117295835 [Asterias rubens]|uniref:uncharacterized protein LOC117295835 n=1 Tax=Asterias rubens TaxID=7604 RepID=UPI0014552CDE|nr:uncharacterized protein LOC117295835 [Asterias rubens]
MSGLGDQSSTENFKGKEVGMEAETVFQNAEDVLEDVKDVKDNMSSADEWVDAADQFEQMTETEAETSQEQVTEGAVGGSQQSVATDGAVGGSQQFEATEGVGGSQQLEATEGVGGSQQSEATEGVGGSQQSEATEGAVGGSQQSEATEGVGGSQQMEATEGVGGSQQSEATEGAVGGSQQLEATEGVGGSQQSEATEGAVGGSQQSEAKPMSEGAVGGWQHNCQAATPVFPPLFPRTLQEPTDPSEDLLRSKFIRQVTKYEGAPVAPSEVFELQWTVYQDELDGYLTDGLVPQDTVASAGIDEESYKQMQQCAQALQDQLFEGNLLLCLGNLRGFRRIFSSSKDPCLRHAFRGNPLEVLQNIYYGGEGILPEDRMLLDDPFHYTKNPDYMNN